MSEVCAISLYMQDVNFKKYNYETTYKSDTAYLGDLKLNAKFLQHSFRRGVLSINCKGVKEPVDLLVKLCIQEKENWICVHSSDIMFHQYNNYAKRVISFDVFQVYKISDLTTLRIDISLLDDSNGRLKNNDVKEYFARLKKNTMKREIVSDFVKKLWTEGLFTDFTFKINDQEFRAHKNILAAQSKVFEKMFCCDMKENTANSAIITDISPEAFSQFLEYLYVRETPKYNDHTFDVFKAAHKYDVEKLMDICEVLILPKIDSKNAIQALQFAHIYDKDMIKIAAFDIIQTELFVDQDLPASFKNHPELINDIFKAKMKMDYDVNAAKMTYKTVFHNITSKMRGQ